MGAVKFIYYVSDGSGARNPRVVLEVEKWVCGKFSKYFLPFWRMFGIFDDFLKWRRAKGAAELWKSSNMQKIKKNLVKLVLLLNPFFGWFRVRNYPKIRHFSWTYSNLPNSPETSGKLMVGDLADELILTGDSDSW